MSTVGIGPGGVWLQLAGCELRCPNVLSLVEFLLCRWVSGVGRLALSCGRSTFNVGLLGLGFCARFVVGLLAFGFWNSAFGVGLLALGF